MSEVETWRRAAQMARDKAGRISTDGENYKAARALEAIAEQFDERAEQAARHGK